MTALLGAMLTIWGGAQVLAQDPYTDEKLQSFVGAALAVNAVVDDWRPKIQAASDDQQAQALAHQAREDMRAAVENAEGITVEEYQEIVQAAQGDPALMGRIDGILGQTRPQ